MSPPSASPPQDAPLEWQRWHQDRIRSLLAPDGWLSLVGLHFLEDGVWNVGSDPANRIHAPGASAGRIGTLLVDGDQVTFVRDLRPDGSASHVTIHGKDMDTSPLVADDRGGPSVLRDGELSFALIRRNGQLALRVRDNRCELRRTFDSFPLYPYDPRLVVCGEATLPGSGETLDITNVTGFVERQPLRAILRFALPRTVDDGVAENRSQVPIACSLAATSGAGDSLFVVFADRTNGRGTYPGGRFLSIDPPSADGRVSIDFNRAHNPVCAFSPFATCPTPPASNRIPLAIEAGERYPHLTRT